MFALVDCNNFYASCETLFNPSLIGKPLVVLSNNDGCVIARSQEARDLGIPMGAPAFTYKNLFQTQGVVSLSSNFPLYADMSERVMMTLESFGYDFEIYSIDEAFLKLPDLDQNTLQSIGETIHKKVLKDVGIRVSIGIAPTKTLAKVGNKYSKKKKTICTVITRDKIDLFLKDFPIEDLWGIGRQSKETLYKLAIYDAYALKYQEESLIKKKLTVTGSRIQLELKGVPCIETKVDDEDTKSILSSRHFPKDTSDYLEIKEALCSFCHLATKKLRKKGLLCSYLSIFIKTNRFKEYHSFSAQIKLPTPTNSTKILLNYLTDGLKKIYKEDLEYKRAGVLLTDFCKMGVEQTDLLSQVQNEKEYALMRVIDSIHNKYGNKTLLFASENRQGKWVNVSKYKSKEYTTSWDALPIVKAN